MGAHPAPFETPAVDEFEYRLIHLDNRIQALLIRDPDADKAAAACDVRVGSMLDPEDIPGIAHFTEHMLFYSSAKYPVEDEYSKFISDHGGHTNAYTSNESTQYAFSVAWDALPEALDRFAQFFIFPLISQDGVAREANAVDSEHGKNLNADPWKKLQLWRAASSPGHPLSRFSTGTLDTLFTAPTAAGRDPHAAVKEFYETHYSASLMRLAVTGRQSLDELEEMVRSRFADVADKGLRPPEFSPDAVTPAETGILIKMVPERDGHSIELQWDTVSEQHHADAAPLHYVSHLLGHEGEGSAFALLKARGWATGLVAGEAATSFSARSFFMVRIDLTEEGHKRVKDVVAVVFRYLDLLKSGGGVSDSIFEEMRALKRLGFEYRDKLDPYSYVSSLAHAMHVYDSSRLLLAMYNVPARFDPELVRQVLDDMAPGRARVMWASKSLADECTSKEKWYGTSYDLGTIPDDWAAAWASGPVEEALHLPAANAFVPSDFSLADEAAPEPIVARTTPLTRLWLRPEPSFKTPKAVVYLHVEAPEGYVSPTSAVLTQLHSKLCNDALSELTYDADMAGLHYGLRSTVHGLLLSIHGYAHRLPRLAAAVAAAALGRTFSAERFSIVKEKLKKDYANMRFEQPYQVALYELAIAMESKRWHVADYESVLPNLEPTDLESFLPRLLGTARVEAYAGGNLPAAAAEALVAAVEAGLTSGGAVPLAVEEGADNASPSSTPTNAVKFAAPTASQAPDARIVKLPPGRPVLLSRPGPNPSNDNSAAVVAFQIGPDALRSNALTELVAHVGKRPAFHQLRTVEQLGYLVWFSAYWTGTVRNLAFIVQSSAHSASYLESRIAAFLPTLREALAALTAEEFGAAIEELAKVKLEKPKRLREVTSRDWREVEDGTLRFRRQEEEVEALRALTHEGLLAFYDVHVLDATTRRKISVQVQATGKGEGSEEGDGEEGAEEEKEVNGNGKEAEKVAEGPEIEIVDDTFAWKRRQELYPSLR